MASFTGSFAETVCALTDGATVSIDASLGNIFLLAALGDRTLLAPTNPTPGQKIIIRHTAVGANRSLTLATGRGGFEFGSTITALTATVAGESDFIECLYNSEGTWSVISYVKGYGIVPLVDGAVHYWKFDSSNSNDSIGSKNGADTNITYSSGNGKINVGGGYGGDSSYISFSSATFGIANSWSLSFWVKVTSFSGTARVIFIGPDAGANQIAAFVSVSGFTMQIFDSGGSNYKEYTTSTGLSTGTWYLCTATWDGADLELYLNGTLQSVTKSTDQSVTQTDTARTMYFSGTPSHAAGLNGALDEVGIWNRALPSIEVDKLYNGGSGLQYPF